MLVFDSRRNFLKTLIIICVIKHCFCDSMTDGEGIRERRQDDGVVIAKFNNCGECGVSYQYQLLYATGKHSEKPVLFDSMNSKCKCSRTPDGLHAVHEIRFVQDGTDHLVIVEDRKYWLSRGGWSFGDFALSSGGSNSTELIALNDSKLLPYGEWVDDKTDTAATDGKLTRKIFMTLPRTQLTMKTLRIKKNTGGTAGAKGFLSKRELSYSFLVLIPAFAYQLFSLLM